MGIMGGIGLMGGFGLIVTLIVVGGIAWLGTAAVRQFSRGDVRTFNGSTVATPPQSAREILAARYARGELTRDEYQSTLKELPL